MDEQLIKSFKLTKVLNENPRCKMINLLGKIGNRDENAIMIIDKDQFNANDASAIDFENVKEIAVNDIYHRYNASCTDNGVKVQLIFPATEKHIAKYSKQSFSIMVETPKVYETIVKPYIDSLPASRINWVNNIFAGNSEQDKLVYKDQEFILLPDSKWNEKQMNDLYLLVIVNDEKLKSIRDLDSCHLQLLKRIEQVVFDQVKGKYNVPSNQLRLFVHYQPTYYRFHIHVTHIEAEYGGMLVGQSHSLHEIIDNIELYGNYYQKKTFRYSIGTEHELFNLFVANSISDAK